MDLFDQAEGGQMPNFPRPHLHYRLLGCLVERFDNVKSASKKGLEPETLFRLSRRKGSFRRAPITIPAARSWT
jgi:hypothetical protein